MDLWRQFVVKELVTDKLWGLVEPLIPRGNTKPARGRGRPPVSDRAALTGIMFVLRTGIPLGIFAQGAGLRERYDLLEAVDGVAAGRRLGDASFGALG